MNKYCELKQRFLPVWHGINPTIIDSAIDELRSCLRVCAQAKGGHSLRATIVTIVDCFF